MPQGPLTFQPITPSVTLRMSSGGQSEADQITAAAGVRAQVEPLTFQPLTFEPLTQQQADPGGFFSGLWKNVNPLPALQGILEMQSSEWDRTKAAADSGNYREALAHALRSTPGASVAHIGVEAAKAQWHQLATAYDLAGKGRYSEAIGHGLAGILPLLGPVAAEAGEHIGQGNVGYGLGEATGLLGSILAPGAIKAGARGLAGKTIPPIAANPNAVAADAVAFGEQAGVPLDAATATGNRFVRAVQHVVDRSLGGSMVAGKAAQGQARGLASVGEQLAAKGYPSPMTAEQAGGAVRDTITGNVRQHANLADDMYGELRKIENDPANARVIQPEVATDDGAAGAFRRRRFAAEGSSLDDIWQGALGEARRLGYKGPADALKREFLERVASARSLATDTLQSSQQAGPAALLADIRAKGGIKPWINDIRQGGPRVKLRDEFRVLGQAFEQVHGMRGGGGILRNSGLELDDLLQQFHSEGKYLEYADPRDLWKALEDISTNPDALKTSTRDLEHFMRAAGVQVGEKWWTQAAETAGSKTVKLPVDLRGVKAAIADTYDALKREAELVPLMGDKAKALTAMDRIMRAQEFESLSVVDAALGELKSFARVTDPSLRTIGQAKVQGAIKQLEAAVQASARSAGQDAVDALGMGRSATIAKHEAQGVLESLHPTENVKIFDRLLARDDSAIAQLRQVAKQAPGELPKLGRAFLDDLLERAKHDGGFGQAGRIASEWEKMGAETKQLLFRDPAYVKDLDNFFRLARLTAENANPSGTAHTLLAAGELGAIFTAPVAGMSSTIGMAALSKLLHSPAGVRLLTKGFKIPAANRAAAVAYATELQAFAQRAGISLAPTAADSQEPTGQPIVRR